MKSILKEYAPFGKSENNPQLRPNPYDDEVYSPFEELLEVTNIDQSNCNQ